MRINRKLYVVDVMYVTTTESNITIFARDEIGYSFSWIGETRWFLSVTCLIIQ